MNSCAVLSDYEKNDFFGKYFILLYIRYWNVSVHSCVNSGLQAWKSAHNCACLECVTSFDLSPVKVGHDLTFNALR